MVGNSVQPRTNCGNVSTVDPTEPQRPVSLATRAAGDANVKHASSPIYEVIRCVSSVRSRLEMGNRCSRFQQNDTDEDGNSELSNG